MKLGIFRPIFDRVPKGGGPWSPGALIFFIFGAPEPHVFAVWSPDGFFFGARSPESFAVEPVAQITETIVIQIQTLKHLALHC